MPPSSVTKNCFARETVSVSYQYESLENKGFRVGQPIRCALRLAERVCNIPWAPSVKAYQLG